MLRLFELDLQRRWLKSGLRRCLDQSSALQKDSQLFATPIQSKSGLLNWYIDRWPNYLDHAVFEIDLPLVATTSDWLRFGRQSFPLYDLVLLFASMGNQIHPVEDSRHRILPTLATFFLRFGVGRIFDGRILDDHQYSDPSGL